MKRADEQHKKIISELDRRKQKRRKDVDEFKVVEGVIDPPTMKTLYRLLTQGTIMVQLVLEKKQTCTVARTQMGNLLP